MLLLLVFCLGLAQGQEVTDEVIDNINEATGLALKDSFRCGLFFPDPSDKSADKSALPYLNLYIFNATFDAKAECDAETPNVERYNKFCAGVVRFDGFDLKWGDFIIIPSGTRVARA